MRTYLIEPEFKSTAPIRRIEARPRRFTPGGLFLVSPVIAMLETINGDYEVGPRKHLNQPIQEVFVIVRSGFEILFKDALGFAHGFESQLPVGHPKLHQSK